MKELLAQYAAHNIWASQEVIRCVALLSDEQINQEIVSSFPSIFKTILHLLDAESIWWQRIKLADRIDRPSESFTGSFNILQHQLLQQSNNWAHWVNNATEMQLQHVFAFMKNKEQHKLQVGQMLLHLFNHNSYHRGQIVTMLRQLGVTAIPSTDFNSYLGGKK
jgi:uncharacterized damage-inducible protein DinB